MTYTCTSQIKKIFYISMSIVSMNIISIKPYLDQNINRKAIIFCIFIQFNTMYNN